MEMRMNKKMSKLKTEEKKGKKLKIQLGYDDAF